MSITIIYDLLKQSVIDIFPFYIIDNEDYQRSELSILDINLNNNFPIPFNKGDLIRCSGDATRLETAIVDIHKDHEFHLTYLDFSNNIESIYADSSYLLHAEKIMCAEIPRNQYMYIAISELLKGTLDLGLFMKIYDIYKHPEPMELSAHNKKRLKKLGIKIK